MEFPAASARRVTANTAQAVNNKIDAKTYQNVVEVSRQGIPAINARLAALDREWDIERCLETGASSLTLIGLGLGTKVDRRWYALSATVMGFLLQHALQGWCPPLPLLRRLGVRTADEINEERYALKALRGDFIDTAKEGNNDAASVLGMAKH